MLRDQQIRESKSSWEPKDTMPTISELTSPSVHGSQIYPRISPDNQQMQQYRQAWILENAHDNDSKGTKKDVCEPNKRCILAMLGMGVLIGLFVCGIPLAVMTTLYLQQKSQTSSNGVNTGSNGTNGATYNSLPSQCTSYTTNTDYTRNVAYTGCCWCDSSMTAGWYRFLGSAGTQLITTPANVNTCGTDYPGWFNGSLPSTVGSTISGTVCVNYIGYVCYTSYSVNSILITNCNGFYVFYLTPMPACYTRYCTT